MLLLLIAYLLKFVKNSKKSKRGHFEDPPKRPQNRGYMILMIFKENLSNHHSSIKESIHCIVFGDYYFYAVK